MLIQCVGAYYLQSRGRLSVAQSEVPVRAGQDHKGQEQAEEDGYKDNVRPQRADQVHEAEETHEEEEETKASVEAGTGYARGRRGRVGRCVGAVRIERWGQGTPQGEPEATKRAEDNEGEGIAEEKLKDPAE